MLGEIDLSLKQRQGWVNQECNGALRSGWRKLEPVIMMTLISGPPHLTIWGSVDCGRWCGGEGRSRESPKREFRKVIWTDNVDDATEFEWFLEGIRVSSGHVRIRGRGGLSHGPQLVNGSPWPFPLLLLLLVVDGLGWGLNINSIGRSRNHGFCSGSSGCRSSCSTFINFHFWSYRRRRRGRIRILFLLIIRWNVELEKCQIKQERLSLRSQTGMPRSRGGY